MTRDYHQFREWAEALAAEDPVNHQNMLEYADAWERDRKWAEIGPELVQAINFLYEWAEGKHGWLSVSNRAIQALENAEKIND